MNPLLAIAIAVKKLAVIVKGMRGGRGSASTSFTSWVFSLILVTVALVAGVKGYPVLVAYSAQVELDSEKTRNEALLLAKRNQDLLAEQQKLAASQPKPSVSVFTPVFGQVFTPAPKKTQAQVKQEALKRSWETKRDGLRKEKIDLENRLKRLGPKDPTKFKKGAQTQQDKVLDPAMKEIVDFVERFGSDYGDEWDRLIAKETTMRALQAKDKEKLAEWQATNYDPAWIRAKVKVIEWREEEIKRIRVQIDKTLPEINLKAIENVKSKIQKVEREIKIAEDTIAKIGSS